MKAVVYKEPFKMAVEEVDVPEIRNGHEVRLKVTTAAICGSDLHMYEGRVNIEPNTIFGHEIMGIVDEVGECVNALQKGDRVVVPFNVSCGICLNCVRGFTSACLVMNQTKPGAAYGYANMGPHQGGQAEYTIIPFADFNCLKLPGEAGDEFENDFVLCADIFPTGWHATELAMVEPGFPVVIYGAGPVGLMAALSAEIKGATEIYVVDMVKDRLALAESMGFIPIDFTKGSSVDQIRMMRQSNKLLIDSMKIGEGKSALLLSGIDAIGYEALSETAKDPSSANVKEQDPMQVHRSLVDLLDYTGHIGYVGVFFPMDPGGVSDEAKNGTYSYPLGMAFEKGLTIAGSQTPVRMYDYKLRNLILAGIAKPSVVISKEISIDEAPEAYKRFDDREDGYTKVVIKFI